MSILEGIAAELLQDLPDADPVGENDLLPIGQGPTALRKAKIKDIRSALLGGASNMATATAAAYTAAGFATEKGQAAATAATQLNVALGQVESATLGANNAAALAADRAAQAETQATAAEQAADAANTGAGAANVAAAAATAAAGNADAKATLADQKAALADTKATLANDKAALADAAANAANGAAAAASEALGGIEEALEGVDDATTAANTAASSADAKATLADNATAAAITATAAAQDVVDNYDADLATKADVTAMNAGDVAAKARANHTGTQAISTVSGLQAALDARATIAALASSSGGGMVGLADGAAIQDAVAVAATPADLVVSSKALVVGSIIRTGDGYLYEVAASDATDAHVTTSGGAKLYVLPQGGAYAAPAFAVSDAASYQAMLDAVPAGATVLNPAGWSVDLTDGLAIGKRLTLAGKGLLNFTAGIAGKAAIQVNADGTILDGLHLYNPNSLGNTSGGRPYGIEIQAHDVIVSNCHIEQFQNAIAQRSNGEWYRSIIVGNQCIDCLGAGEGQASTSTLGEDRGDGITAWGAGTVIANNIVTLKDGEDGRIGIHAEALGPFIVTPGPYDNSAVSVVGNHVYGTWRRGIVFEGMRGATAVGNTVVGSTWWALAIVQGNIGCTMADNTVYWTQANTTWGSWSPLIAPLMLGFSLDSCSMVNNAVYMAAGSKAAIGFAMENTLEGVQTDCAMIGNRLICEDDTVEFTVSLARVRGSPTYHPTRPVFRGNSFRGDAPSGLIVQMSVSPIVADNVIVSTADTVVSGSYGILLSDAGITHPSVSGNYVAGWDQGIRTGSITASGSIDDNMIVDCPTGIWGGASVANIWVRHNRFENVTTRITGFNTAMRAWIRENDGQTLHVEQAWNPGAISAGAAVTTSITVTGAAVGDVVEVTRRSAGTGTMLFAEAAAEAVTIGHFSPAGATLSNATYSITVNKRGTLA